MPTLLPIALALLAWADPAPPPTALDMVSALESVLADAIAKAEPSVVAIARKKSDNDETLAIRGRNTPHPTAIERRFPLGRIAIDDDPFTTDALSFDSGSGVVIGKRGEILTAFHVVKGARSLHVRAAGRQSFEAEIIAADPRSDLAVIAPREQPGLAAPKLVPIAMGDASTLKKGSFLVALGNPFNAARDGKPSASWGILANTARKIEPMSDEVERQELQLRNYPTLLQLDAKLNLGMSGGAVINLKGELVGLTTAAANAAGFDAQAGYAIPMDALGRKVVETLKEGKEYEYGFLGIRLDVQQGTNRVMSADPGTPAWHGGVLVDDVVEAVGDVAVTDADRLVVAINTIPAGETAILKILRGGKRIEKTVRLAKLRVRAATIATNRPAPWRGLRIDYTSTLTNAPLGPEMHEALAREGVLITEVVAGTEADKAGLKTNQVITRVDDAPVHTPRQFAEAVSKLTGPVKLDTDAGSIVVK